MLNCHMLLYQDNCPARYHAQLPHVVTSRQLPSQVPCSTARCCYTKTTAQPGTMLNCHMLLYQDNCPARYHAQLPHVVISRQLPSQVPCSTATCCYIKTTAQPGTMLNCHMLLYQDNYPARYHAQLPQV